MPKHPVSPKGVLQVFWLVQSQQNSYQIFDLFKVSKTAIPEAVIPQAAILEAAIEGAAIPEAASKE